MPQHLFPHPQIDHTQFNELKSLSNTSTSLGYVIYNNCNLYPLAETATESLHTDCLENICRYMYHFHIQKFIYWNILSFSQTESIVSGKHYGIFGDPVLCQQCILVPYTKILQIYGHISNVRWPPKLLHDFVSTIHYKRTTKISPWLCVNNSLQENHQNVSMTMCQQFITRKPPQFLHDFVSTIQENHQQFSMTLCQRFITREPTKLWLCVINLLWEKTPTIPLTYHRGTYSYIIFSITLEHQ